VWFPYAEAADVPASVAEEFDDVAFTLRTASYAIRSSLKTARFDTDTDGRPTDSDVEACIKDATLALMAFWAETGDSTGAGAQNGGGSILSVSRSRMRATPRPSRRSCVPAPASTGR